MRLKFIAALIFVLGVSTIASTASAQGLAQAPDAQQQSASPVPAGTRPIAPGMVSGGGVMGGVMAGTAFAQGSTQQTQIAQLAQNQQQPATAAPPYARPAGPGMMTQGNVQMRGPMGGAQNFTVRSQGPATGNPLQMVTRLLGALDDSRVRTMLGITDQQADSLHKLVLDTETFTITTGAAIAVDSLELRELLRADKPDRAAVKSKGDEISKATSDLISHYLDAVLDAKQILTPEQQKMIADYLANGAPAPPPPPVLPAPPARR